MGGNRISIIHKRHKLESTATNKNKIERRMNMSTCHQSALQLKN